MQANGKYEKTWASASPGCMIILLDQSGSMSSAFGNVAKNVKDKSKAGMVATVLNGFLDGLVLLNSENSTVKNRADIAVFGYEGTKVDYALAGALRGKDFVTLSDLDSNPLAIEKRKGKEMDERGQVSEVEVDFPVWVKPVAGGGTPMCGALRKARDIAANWVSTHPDNAPPVIVNVSDGGATDGQPNEVLKIAEEISRISTSDGTALLYNVHITHVMGKEVAFPTHESELPNDPYAKLLFSASSIIPDKVRATYQAATNETLPAGARGMIFNGDAASVQSMFTFMSVNMTAGPDPNL